MKAKWGMMMTDGRGKLGGHVMTKTRSGATVRTKVTPTNPQTTAQSTARSILAAASQAWSSLTAAQRETWLAAVQAFSLTNIFGDGYLPSGKSLYTRIRANLVAIGQSPLTTAPLPVAVTAPGLTGITSDVSLSELNISYTGTDAAAYLAIEATAPQTAGTYNPSGRYRVIDVLIQNTASPINAWAAYVTKFGAPAAGQKVFVRLKSIKTATGQNGAYESANTIVVP